MYQFCTVLTEGIRKRFSGRRLISCMMLPRRTGISLRRNSNECTSLALRPDFKSIQCLDYLEKSQLKWRRKRKREEEKRRSRSKILSGFSGILSRLLGIISGQRNIPLEFHSWIISVDFLLSEFFTTLFWTPIRIEWAIYYSSTISRTIFGIYLFFLHLWEVLVILVESVQTNASFFAD